MLKKTAADVCFYVDFNYLEWCRFVKNRFFLVQTRNYILTVKQKFSDFPLLRSLRYKIRIFDAYVQKQWVKKRRVPVWAKSVSVGDDCNIFTNIYLHLHSCKPTLVPHHHPSCCFDFGTYRPTTTLSSIVMTITEVIDSAPATSPQSNNHDCISNNYQTIFKKALVSTLSYGRPRY